MIYALFFLAGSLIGFFLAIKLFKRSKVFRELEGKLAAKEAELQQYQDQVGQHFSKTAELFAEIQVRQDRLASHLQDGAKSLRQAMIDPHDTIAITGYTESSKAPRDYPLTQV